MPARKRTLPPLLKSLSARLLLLTIAFVMLAEVLIYAPSIGRFRKVYLEDHIAAAHLATLTLFAMPDYRIGEDAKAQLLRAADAHGIVLRQANTTSLMVSRDMPPTVDMTIDIRQGGFVRLIVDALAAQLRSDNRILRVIGSAPDDPGVQVEIIIDERPMRLEMIDYSRRILALSIVISLITAGLVFASLQWLFVAPLRRTTESMIAFRDDPEDGANIIKPSRRSDEIGTAQRELAVMQEGLRAALGQKARLAALGTAVTKINHDLRNILASARLVSDRLATSDHPDVKRMTPPLVSAIDRAVTLCTQTLDFSRHGLPALRRSRFFLAGLVADAGAELHAVADGKMTWKNQVLPVIEVEADRDQLFRVLANLGGNAAEAGASMVTVSAGMGNGGIVVRVADNGPGLAPAALDRLFIPFAGSARAGGTGLGLAIVREILRAHGGDITLVESSENGTVFDFTLPVGRM